MTQLQLIEALTDICIRQAQIIREQAFALEQCGALGMEDEAETVRRELWEIVGE